MKFPFKSFLVGLILVCSSVFANSKEKEVKNYFEDSALVRWDSDRHLFCASVTPKTHEGFCETIFLNRVRADKDGIYFLKHNVVLRTLKFSAALPEVAQESQESSPVEKFWPFSKKKKAKKIFINYQFVLFKDGCFKANVGNKTYMLKSLRASKEGVYFIKDDISKQLKSILEEESDGQSRK